MAIRLLAFGDAHIPYHDPSAVEVFARVAARIKPDILVCLGDLLDCGQFSAHAPTWGLPESDYADDVATARELLTRLRRHAKKAIWIEGNHEYRIDRWAAATKEGRGTHSMLSPRRCLADIDYQYIPYGMTSGRYPHYRVNSRLVAVHGWSYARNAARVHLQMAQGRSVIYGHTHRADAVAVQAVWSRDRIIEARSAGCLCRRVPLYGTGSPVEWVHGFVLGYLGRRSDTLYSVPILGDRCILPDGSEVSA